LCAFDGGSVIGFKDCEAGVEQLAFGDDDDIESPAHLVPSKDLSDQPLRAVSLNRAAQLPSSGNPQPAACEIGRQEEERTVAAVNPDAALIHLLKFWPPANPFTGTKSHA
jgi:hypothetical protein